MRSENVYKFIKFTSGQAYRKLWGTFSINTCLYLWEDITEWKQYGSKCYWMKKQIEPVSINLSNLSVTAYSILL